MNTLLRLEQKIESLVEEKILNLLVHKKLEDQISKGLAFAMVDQIQSLESGTIHAPNFYLITVSPTNALELRKNTDFLDNLTIALESIGSEAGFTYVSKIIISVNVDSAYKDDQVQVIASFFRDTEDETRSFKVTSGNSQKEEQNESTSYLILEGNKTVPLEHQVINLGRRPTNQIVIDNPKISRDHAQIREIDGRYKIFDLNSKGGTLINGIQIRQKFLKSGDVISLAGYSLIFIQDSKVNIDENDDTVPFVSGSIL
ncbi:FhaA domain-containing protein [Chloroflexota bacterium]